MIPCQTTDENIFNETSSSSKAKNIIIFKSMQQDVGHFHVLGKIIGFFKEQVSFLPLSNVLLHKTKINILLNDL